MTHSPSVKLNLTSIKQSPDFNPRNSLNKIFCFFQKKGNGTSLKIKLFLVSLCQISENAYL